MTGPPDRPFAGRVTGVASLARGHLDLPVDMDWRFPAVDQHAAWPGPIPQKPLRPAPHHL